MTLVIQRKTGRSFPNGMLSFNQVIEDDWFESFEDNPKANIKFLTHIAFSPSGQIINYKPSAVDKGLGALISMLILKKYGDIGLTMVVWDNLKDSLSPTIRRGFRSKNMADLNTDFTGSMAEFRTELNKRIQKDIDAWISDFEQFLDI